MVLFGKGAVALEKGAGIDRKAALEVLESGGTVPRALALRCRVRYFTDGAVLGSREFVQTWFEAHRDHLSPKRASGPRAMQGTDWDGLSVYRGLRRAVFG
jgi:putative transposase